MATEALGQLASAGDRERALELLRAAGSQLGLEELEQRLDAVVRAQTVDQLAVLVWDLDPTRRAAASPRRAWRSVWFRLHTVVYGLTNSLLVGTWALTGHGFFWPFFPVAGWGVGLGVHAVAVRAVQERRQQADPRQLAWPSPVAVDAWSNGPGSPPPSRRLVVAMFVDVVDSTRLTEVIGDEEWSRIRSRCRSLLRGCYGAHGGNEVSAQGDGFLARFDSPSEAVRCAIEIQRRLRDQREETGFALAVRIGVHAGEAVEETGDLLGTVINMASRVTAEARPAEVLVTEAVADQLEGPFELDDRGLRTLKGLSRPRHLAAVRWAD